MYIYIYIYIYTYVCIYIHIGPLPGARRRVHRELRVRPLHEGGRAARDPAQRHHPQGPERRSHRRHRRRSGHHADPSDHQRAAARRRRPVPAHRQRERPHLRRGPERPGHRVEPQGGRHAGLHQAGDLREEPGRQLHSGREPILGGEGAAQRAARQGDGKLRAAPALQVRRAVHGAAQRHLALRRQGKHCGRRRRGAGHHNDNNHDSNRSNNTSSDNINAATTTTTNNNNDNDNDKL